MNNVDKIIEAIKPLAEKIGQGGEFLYRVYYRQTIIEGILQIVFSLLAVIATAIIYRYWARYAMKQHKERKAASSYYDGEWYGLGVFGMGIVSLVIAGLAFAVTIGGVLKVANPNFYTIDRIIRSVQAKEIK